MQIVTADDNELPIGMALSPILEGGVGATGLPAVAGHLQDTHTGREAGSERRPRDLAVVDHRQLDVRTGAGEHGLSGPCTPGWLVPVDQVNRPPWPLAATTDENVFVSGQARDSLVQ